MLPPDPKVREIVPAGSYPMCLCALVGPWVQDGFQGKLQTVVSLTFEITGELSSFGEPYLITVTKTFSYHRMAALRSFAEALAGGKFVDSGPDKFNLKDALGKAVLGRVVHVDKEDGTKRASLESVMPLPKGMIAPTVIGEAFYFNADETDPEAVNFPPWLFWAQDKIVTARNAAAARDAQRKADAKKSTAEPISDDLPF